MVEIGKENEHLAMDILTDEHISIIYNVILLIDKNLTFEEVNYKNGTVTLGYKYNEGTDDFFIRKDFMTINVAAESVGCMVWEIINAVFKRYL